MERRALLLRAGFELLGDDTAPVPTVRAVCGRARLNPRYFYEGFDGLDDLVVAVYDAVVEQLTGRLLAAAGSAPEQPAQTRAVIEAIVEFVDEDRRRGRVLARRRSTTRR
ncbi:MAG: hypothetical protein U5R31_07100 [Acidimicrobiia bacterium]|nr:hypothetical protein [Acidimicrobiia bacterium]